MFADSFRLFPRSYGRLRETVLELTTAIRRIAQCPKNSWRCGLGTWQKWVAFKALNEERRKEDVRLEDNNSFLTQGSIFLHIVSSWQTILPQLRSGLLKAPCPPSPPWCWRWSLGGTAKGSTALSAFRLCASRAGRTAGTCSVASVSSSRRHFLRTGGAAQCVERM